MRAPAPARPDPGLLSRLLDELRLVRLRDDHVTPPGPGREEPSRTAAVWRFRALVLAVLVVAVLLAVLLVRWLTGAYDQDPGVDTGRPSASAPVAVGGPSGS